MIMQCMYSKGQCLIDVNLKQGLFLFTFVYIPYYILNKKRNAYSDYIFDLHNIFVLYVLYVGKRPVIKVKHVSSCCIVNLE
jgi:hypothetical protein